MSERSSLCLAAGLTFFKFLSRATAGSGIPLKNALLPSRMGLFLRMTLTKGRIFKLDDRKAEWHEDC